MSKVCTKCGNPLIPASSNFCANCWLGDYQKEIDNYRMSFYHQKIERFVPEGADEAKDVEMHVGDEGIR